MIPLSVHATFLVPYLDSFQLPSRLRAPNRNATTLSNFVPRSRARLPPLPSPPTRTTRRARRSSSTPWRPLPPPRRRGRMTTAALGRQWCPPRRRRGRVTLQGTLSLFEKGDTYTIGLGTNHLIQIEIFPPIPRWWPRRIWWWSRGPRKWLLALTCIHKARHRDVQWFRSGSRLRYFLPLQRKFFD